MDRWTKLYQIIPNINPQLQKNKTDIVLVHQARGNSFCELTVIVLWMPCCLSGKHPEEEWGLIDWGCFLLCKPQSPAPTESGCAADICSKRSNCGDFKKNAHRDTFEVRLSVQDLTCVKADVTMTNESQRTTLLCDIKSNESQFLRNKAQPPDIL